MQSQYLAEAYTPPGGLSLAERSPNPVTYIWGGSVSLPMRMEHPAGSTDSKMASVACGRTERFGVTDDGKLITWEVYNIQVGLCNDDVSMIMEPGMSLFGIIDDAMTII